jgi:polysaccharide export outer membrane protein
VRRDGDAVRGNFLEARPLNRIPLSRPKSWHYRGLCLLLAGLTGCGTTRPMFSSQDSIVPSARAAASTEQIVSTWGVKPNASAATKNPEILPGYLLTMSYAEDSKLNGEFRVELNGDLVLPYDITINTSGLTLSELKKKLTDLYRPYFKTSSEIQLNVKEKHIWLDVRGLVDKPGLYLVEPGSSLDYVIGLAGGLSKEPIPLYVRIQKGSKAFTFDLSQYYNQGGNSTQILGWLGGEVLFFQKESAPIAGESAYQKPIYMLGEVRRPGEYAFNSGTDYVDAMVQAGGFTERANPEHIEVIRQIDGKRSVANFSWGDFQNAPALQQGDIVMVFSDRTTKVEKRTSMFVGILSAIAAIVTTTILILAYDSGKPL